jgi:hypothetical protein
VSCLNRDNETRYATNETTPEGDSALASTFAQVGGVDHRRAWSG